MAWLHTWTGLVVGWVLFFVFVTGTAGYAAHELDRWMRPELPLATSTHHAPKAQMLEQATAFLEARAAGASTWSIQFPGDRSQPTNLGVSWQAPPKEGEGRRGRFSRALLDAHTGEEIHTGPVRETGGGHLLYRMHYRLHYIPYDAALRFVGICTLLMFLAIISGVITHKKIFSDFFTFRPGKGQRSWLDAHNLISVMTLPFFVMITYSGLLFFMFQYMPLGVSGVYGTGEENARTFQSELYPRLMTRPSPSAQPAPLAALQPMLAEAERRWGEGQVQRIQVRQPYLEGSEVIITKRGTSTLGTSPTLKFAGISGLLLGTDLDESAAMGFRNVMFGLHEGHFAGPLLRWLYVLSGFLGAGIIATGLVLWTVKRRAKQDKLVKAGGKHEFGFRLVECLNIGSIAGLPFAIAVYFCANRLLPAMMEGRREWEVHAMFIAWGVMLVYPALRAPMRAWIEELWLVAGAFMLLPLLNALTTSRHLGITIPAGDWALASIDLTFVALAAFFALAAHKVRRKVQHTLTATGQIKPRARTATPAPAVRTATAAALVQAEQQV